MRMICQNHPDFNYEEAKNLYLKDRELIKDVEDFDEVLNGSHFYSFFLGDEYIGSIYVYLVGEKVFLNGYATRGHHQAHLEAMRKVLASYNCDIYARSVQKTAILCLYRLGFKKIGKILYKYERT